MATIDTLNRPSVDDLTSLIGATGFDTLNDELKGQAISAVKDAHDKKGERETGRLGKLFGTKAENISLYIAFLICMCLILVGLVYICIPLPYKVNSNLEFWQIISPIITGTLGYIFGTGANPK